MHAHFQLPVSYASTMNALAVPKNQYLLRMRNDFRVNIVRDLLDESQCDFFDHLCL